jgi:pimeloyl-ACP methyl ester carboxylesterase
MAKKTPTVLHLIRFAFKTCDIIAPKIASKWAIKLFLSPLRAPYTQKGLKLMEDVEHYAILANGKKMRAYRMGSGPEVICIHGWAGKATQFADLAYAITEAGFTFVAVDVWAHGKCAGKMASMFDFADATEKLVQESQNLKGVIGHSLGAASVSLAVHDGLTIPRFVAMGSPTLPDDILNSFRKIIQAPYRINQVIKNACAEVFKRDFDEIAMANTVRSVTCPLLAIHGEEDFDVGIFHLDALKLAKADIDCMRVAKLGHRRILKDKAVIERIISFMKHK